MKQKNFLNLAAALLCLLAASCLNPALDTAETPGKQTGDDGIITARTLEMDAVAGLLLGDDTAGPGVKVAVLTLPLPWEVKLPDVEDNALFTIVDERTAEQPAVSRLPLLANKIEDDEGEDDTGEDDKVRVVIKEDTPPLAWGKYRVVLEVSNPDIQDSSFTKKFDFTVTQTPPPFKNAPGVYPYITGVGKNKLTVRLSQQIVGADGYKVYVGTAGDSSAALLYNAAVDKLAFAVDITDIDGDSVDGGLPDETTYYVWLSAYNSEGESALSPAAKVTTSFKLPEAFYKDDDGNSFFAWDSYSGVAEGDHSGGDLYVIYPPGSNERIYPGGILHYGPIRENLKGTLGTSGFRGDIVYFYKEDRAIGRSKWGEKLTGPSGVFIIRYHDDSVSSVSGMSHVKERRYMGIYFYGLGTIQTVDVAYGPSGSSLGLPLCYFGNSYYLPTMVNPEVDTFEEAFNWFTLANINKFIAFVAVPWYRDYDPVPRNAADYEIGAMDEQDYYYDGKGNPIWEENH
jgi:hypothetical protein